jgi:hypothetical protein
MWGLYINYKGMFRSWFMFFKWYLQTSCTSIFNVEGFLDNILLEDLNSGAEHFECPRLESRSFIKMFDWLLVQKMCLQLWWNIHFCMDVRYGQLQSFLPLWVNFCEAWIPTIIKFSIYETEWTIKVILFPKICYYQDYNLLLPEF